MQSDLLRADVEHADAMMLLDYLKQRKSTEPLSMREACEAVHRTQGPTPNIHDEEHMKVVIDRLALAGVNVSIGKPLAPVNTSEAYAALERLPMLPVYRLR
jgi:hypothetical protein